ncbi:MAG: TIGR04157 family glycosyltransferase [Tannerella sp.]|jgi:glycosyltransferase|nr:TIGR04157 family glycosyltransferase [Tannerella sp.]
MNLYIFHTSSEAAVYGIGTYIRELTTALRHSKIKVCVINLRAHISQIRIEETSDGIKRWYFPEPMEQLATDHLSDLYYRNIVYLLQLYIEDKSNLIFHLNANQSSKFAEELKKVFDCKIVLTIHYFDWCFKLSGNLTHFRQLWETQQVVQGNEDTENLKEAFQKEKETFEVVDHIICLSKNTKHILQDDYKIKPDKITVVYNGLTDSKIIVEKSVLRQKYGISDVPVILFAGRLDSIKGLTYALRAFRIVLKTHPECRFIIAGSGEFNTHMIECEDIWMNVIWTGLINREKLYELYAIADLGIMPSFHEQCSYVAIEMMMHGLPIIGSTSTGLSEMIENNITGLHIPVIEYTDGTEIDSSLLAEKVLYLLQHSIETKQMGQNGRKKYLNNYSLEIFRTNMLRVYESICCGDSDKIKTLVVTGQHNHKWEVSHMAIKQILENSGLFAVDIAVSPKPGEYMFNFKPNFASYQLVVLDYYGDRWPEETEKSFLNFVGDEGGVVVYHAANNAFRDWKEYNRIIGFGGWENRNEADGPYIYMKEGKLVYDKETPGPGGSHGPQHEFMLQCSNSDHPVTKGLPTGWRHAKDELYDRMRGPGIVNDVLFWAHSDPATRGSGRDEMAIFTVDYRDARIFHTTLGHAGNTLEDNIAMQCTGFQVTLLRGAEWAATGKVTQQVPDDFPTATNISLRKNYK